MPNSISALTFPLRRPLESRPMRAGLVLSGVLAAAAFLLAASHPAQHLGLSVLTCAIVVGIAGGNTFFPKIAEFTGAGIDYAKTTVLRLGVVLFGLHITWQEIASVGRIGILIDAVMVALTFGLAVVLGTRVFRLDRETSLLIGAGSAICGAAAVLATEPVVRAEPHKVSVAVACVVVFGTLAMVVYPALYPHLGLSEYEYGIYVGSTIHEVAQVVVAGHSVGAVAAEVAVIEKMLRVMMLAPFLLLLARRLRKPGAVDGRRITVPWFAVLFIAVSLLNSTSLIDAGLRANLLQLDTVLLAMAMAALGLRTNFGAIRQAGVRPVALGAVLSAFLLVGGYGVNQLLQHFLAP